MKTLFFCLIVISLAAVSCRSVSIFQLESYCEADSHEMILNELCQRLESLGFSPVLVMPDSLIYVKVQEVSWQGGADLANPNKWSGADEIRSWMIISAGDRITGRAREQTMLKNVYGDTRFVHDKYLNDEKADSKTKWYWDIRNYIEEKCPGEFKIIEK